MCNIEGGENTIRDDETTVGPRAHHCAAVVVFGYGIDDAHFGYCSPDMVTTTHNASAAFVVRYGMQWPF